jgi:protein O-GlcNAc transferase
MSTALSDQDLSQLEKMYFEGQFLELEMRAVELTTQYPHLGLAWSILGAALTGQGKPALAALAHAAQLLPLDAQAQLQQADALFSCGQLADSVAAYQRAIVLQPFWAAAHNNLGNAFKALEQLQNARSQYELALQCDPQFALAHYNLAVLNRDETQWDKVEPELRRALDADPTLAVAWVELGSLLKDAGDLAGAEQALAEAVELSPHLLQARLNLAAIFLMRNAAKDSLRTLQDTIGLYPSSASAHLQLGQALHALGRSVEALASVRHALTLQYDLIDGHRYLADIAFENGNMEEAIACLEQAIELDSANIPSRSTLLFYRAQVANASAEELFDEHTAFGRLLDRKYGQLRLPVVSPDNQPRGRLRVGLASGDFNNHIVGRSLLPVVEHLAAMEGIELIAYCNTFEEDDWTGKLRQHFSSWSIVAGMTPLALAKRIRADAVDVLIDLAGHTPMNCLETFSLRPAPVQVSWLGYTWTTGLQEIDYYFADRCWLPPGQFDHLFVEKLVYLTAFLPFEFRGESPMVNSLPSSTGAPFTFGSFNHVRKVSSAVLEAWISILLALPDSRLLFGGIDDGPQRERILATFRASGIPAERLLFFPRCQAYDYLQLHHLVDLCLDAFPYPSATTIQHALWMGVPTVTWAGATPVARAGTSVLQHLELPQYIATSFAEYLDIAVHTAQHPESLSVVRRELRHKLTSSAQGRSSNIAVSVYAALQTMWTRYLEGKPAQSFLA